MAATAGPNDGVLRGWVAGEDGWDVGMDQNLRLFDSWNHASVIGVLDEPPLSPAAGDRYIIGTGSGAWADHDGELACWSGTAWEIKAPAKGWDVWREDLYRTARFDGADWLLDASYVKLESSAAADLQALVDELVAAGGGVLELGPGIFPVVLAGLTVGADVIIRGQGRGVTVIKQTLPEHEHHDIVTLAGVRCGLEDLSVQGATALASLAGEGDYGRGVVVAAPGVGDQNQNFLRRVEIFDTNGYGLALVGSEGGHGVVFGFHAEEVQVWNQANQASLFVGNGVTTCRYESCRFNAITDNNHGDSGVTEILRFAGGRGHAFSGCNFESTSGELADDIPYIVFDNDLGPAAENVAFRNCWFEPGILSPYAGHAAYFVKAVEGLLLHVRFESCTVVRAGGTAIKGGKFFLNECGAGVAHRAVSFVDCEVMAGAGVTDSPADAVLELDMGAAQNYSTMEIRNCSAVYTTTPTTNRPWRTYHPWTLLRSTTLAKLQLPMLESVNWNAPAFDDNTGEGTLIYYHGVGGVDGPGGDGSSGLFFLGNIGGVYRWHRVGLTGI